MSAIVCERCNHVNCHGQSEEFRLCQFCEDGVPCPEAQRLEPRGRPLKEKERTIAARALANGATVREAASQSGLSEPTVRAVRRQNSTTTFTRQRTHTVSQSTEIEQVEQEAERAEAEQLCIDLPSGAGRVSIRFEGHIFDMTQMDRNFLFGLIDRMKAYARNEAIEAPKKFSIFPGMEKGFMADMFQCLEPDQVHEIREWLKEFADDYK